MPTSCCAIGCTNHNLKKECRDRRVSFFKFPKDPLLKKAWLFEMRRQDFNPSRTTKICSDHFEKDCFTYQKNTNRRCLVKDALPSIFAFLKKTTKRKSLNPPLNGGTSKRASVFKTDANGKLQFVGYLPGREPRGHPPRKTFKDFLMSKEAFIAQSKLRETNEKLAVLHRRRLSLRAKSKFSESSVLLYPPYESHFVNYKGELSSLSKKRSLETNVTSEDPLNGVHDPSVVEILSSDDESSNHRSECLSSKKSSQELPLNSDKSSNSSLHQPTEENLSSDESSVDSLSYQNVSSKKKELDTISALDESNLSSDGKSTNFTTFFSNLSSPISSASSPEKSENVTENGALHRSLTPLGNNSSGKKSHKISSENSAVSSPNTKLFKFKHSYFERLAKDKSKSKLNERLVRAQGEKTKLREKIRHLQRSTKYWKQKNANLKSLLDQQDVEQDDD